MQFPKIQLSQTFTSTTYAYVWWVLCIVMFGVWVSVSSVSAQSVVPTSLRTVTVTQGTLGCANPEGCTVVYFEPLASALDAQTEYSYFVSQNVASAKGATFGSDQTINDAFTTGSNLCQISSVRTIVMPPGIVKSTDQFTCAGRDDCPGDQQSGQSGNQHQWLSQAYDASLTPLTASYEWTASDPSNLYTLSNHFVANPYITTDARDGQASYTVRAFDPLNASAGQAQQTLAVSSTLCENPWPAYGSFPFQDATTDFEISYCRDQGSGRVCSNGGSYTNSCRADSDCATGETCVADPRDDLPSVGTPVEQAGPSGSGIVKEFFFLPTTITTDNIAIRVYDNPDRLSPFQWYQENVTDPGSTQSTTVDGYAAIRDGRTVYVSAAQGSGSYGTNMFLMSYNNNADPRTVSIYNQMLENWHFTTNLIDQNICQGVVPPVACTSDIDCQGLGGTETCLQDATKIRRDLERVVSLGVIRTALAEYHAQNGSYPYFGNNSFVVGMTTSRWPVSWAALGSTLGIQMPHDPIDAFSSCPAGADQSSCWDSGTGTFTCEDGSHIFQYVSDPSGSTYTLYANMENDSADWSGFGSNDGTDSCRSFSVGP